MTEAEERDAALDALEQTLANLAEANALLEAGNTELKETNTELEKMHAECQALARELAMYRAGDECAACQRTLDEGRLLFFYRNLTEQQQRNFQTLMERSYQVAAAKGRLH